MMITAQEDKAVPLIAQELQVENRQIEALYRLFAEDATVPFIARYRKEATGGLDEVVIQRAKELMASFRELFRRKEYILKSLREREILTPELEKSITETFSLSELEDIFLPYKPKRRTRAIIAREKGLAPLAKLLYSQRSNIRLAEAAAGYIAIEKGVESQLEALAGAADIIAEMISEDRTLRSSLRGLFLNSAVLESRVNKKKQEEGGKFRDYFAWSEKAACIPSHRILAVFRGESEGVLRLKIRPEEQAAQKLLSKACLRASCPYKDYMRNILHDAYIRLLAPSLENEIRAELKTRADREAVKVFAQNLRELLMSAPLGSRPILALDPGIRTGCKLVALNERGDLLANTVIYHDRKPAEAAQILRDWVQKFSAEAIAVGNGTFGRETESFIRGLKLEQVKVVLVSESGASIYSASEIARLEFPDYDLTVRGAVSIGRRLLDPLAELVKLDPKSIGVGQYQHDVDQGLLKEGLDAVVMSCVNAVGVELNTASKELLGYVSGLGSKLAENIVTYRSENGKFSSREELLQVPRLGARAYEQAAGFIRVRESANPLDQSAVHPESYRIVEAMAEDYDASVAELLLNAALRERIDLKRYISEKAGLPTLQDIISELAKPGRDPREEFVSFSFNNSVKDITDLQEGMKLPGVITNVTNFGAFVDIGVYQDGLVHISQLADRFVKDPNAVVRVQQKVVVRVLEVDEKRNRIALSLRLE